MGEIHELSVLALSLIWFAGATPDFHWQNKQGQTIQTQDTLHLFCPTFRTKSSGPVLVDFYRFSLPSPQSILGKLSQV